MTDLRAAAHAVNARSRRSRQRKLGPSDVGTCRRKAGYLYHGTPRGPEGDKMAAMIGTWIHRGALAVLRSEYGAFIEVVVEDELLRGHVDALFLESSLEPRGLLVDLKTRADEAAVARVKLRGPTRAELFQVHLGAAVLIDRGAKPRKTGRQAEISRLGPIRVPAVQLRYLDRARGRGEYVYEQPYDADITAEARDWLRQVYDSPGPEALPRDQDGPGLSYVCDSCPFREPCWGPPTERAPQVILLDEQVLTAAEALADYAAAGLVESDAAARKKKARAILDGTPRGTYGEWQLGWSGGGGEPGEELNVEEVLELLRIAGVEPPMRPKARRRPSISVRPA